MTRAIALSAGLFYLPVPTPAYLLERLKVYDAILESWREADRPELDKDIAELTRYRNVVADYRLLLIRRRGSKTKATGAPA